MPKAIFPYPTPVQAIIWWCSLWSRSVMLGSAKIQTVNTQTNQMWNYFRNIPTYCIWSR